MFAADKGCGISPLKSPQHNGLLKLSDLDKTKYLQGTVLQINELTNDPPGNLPEFHPKNK